MKKNWKRLLSAVLTLVMMVSCVTVLTGCNSDEPELSTNPPITTETPSTDTAATDTAVPGDVAETDNFDMSSSAGDTEPVIMPEMVGTVVHKFLLTKEVSTSLGAIEQFTAYIELYDTPNAEGKTALLGVCQGSSISYTTGTWSQEEDSTFRMPIDEFTIYETKEIDGIQTFINIRYTAGMMSKGVVDIPMVDVSTPTPDFGGDVAGNEMETEIDASSEGGDASSEGGDVSSEGGDASSEGGDVSSEGGDASSEGGDASSEGTVPPGTE